MRVYHQIGLQSVSFLWLRLRPYGAKIEADRRWCLCITPHELFSRTLIRSKLILHNMLFQKKRPNSEGHLLLLVIGGGFEDKDENDGDLENPGKLELFPVPVNLMAWAVSSVVEHFIHTEGVA